MRQWMHSSALILSAACSAAPIIEQGIDGAAKVCDASQQVFDGGPGGVAVCATLDAIDAAIAAVLKASGPPSMVKRPSQNDLTQEQRAAVSLELKRRGNKVVSPTL